MITIDQDQYDRLLQGDPQGFIAETYRFLCDTQPGAMRGIPEHLMLDMIAAAIARARRHGFDSDEQVMGFVGLMFEIAPNFDEEPTLRAILDDRSRPAAERWEALFADTPELTQAWERAAYPTFYDHKAWLGPES
ncbi:hypothetical protein [Plasticicumulans acidivorans]|uniref:Uncharacterized protein n=1 Tax=Plasticicumulans acidivorans TaxID=886464 RepID=A0A317N3N3_9GAMM|nr:hypothetical protein [Plasticicumulans acidivorans]PWV64757.1 hypothetical protein C7443_102410 [Plasticicumulans acidivorans]